MDAPLFESTPMYYDYKSIIQISYYLFFHECTMHIEIDCHFIRHHLQHETITLPFVSSSLQIVNLFTDAFCFWLLIDKLSMFSVIVSQLMYCDNKSATQITHNLFFHEFTKHIEIDFHFTCHHIQHETIAISLASSSLQIVDWFTKIHFVFVS